MNDTGNLQADVERIKAEHRALAILRFLQREPTYRANERIVAAYLDLLALGGVRKEIRDAIAALERMGLVRTEEREGLLILCLTQLGEDVGLGRKVAEGVLKPAPDEIY